MEVFIEKDVTVDKYLSNIMNKQWASVAKLEVGTIALGIAVDAYVGRLMMLSPGFSKLTVKFFMKDQCYTTYIWANPKITWLQQSAEQLWASV